MSSKKTQHLKAMKANTFKVNKGKGKVVKPRKSSILFQADTGTGPELKAVDLNTSFAPPLTSSFATPQLLNGTAQGAGATNRLGRKMMMKSFQMRYTCSVADGDDASQHRIVVVYDKQANGAAPIATDVFSANDFRSPLNLNNSDRFVVICDEVTESVQSSVINISGQRYVKLNMETIFQGSSNGIADIASGSVYMFIANNATPTIGVVTAAFVYTRIRFTDQ